MDKIKTLCCLDCAKNSKKPYVIQLAFYRLCHYCGQKTFQMYEILK